MENSSTNASRHDGESDGDIEEKGKEETEVQAKPISLKEKIKSNRDDIDEANRLKAMGNTSYTNGEYDTAIQQYTQAIDIIMSSVEQTKNDNFERAETEEQPQRAKIVEIKENDISCSEELAIYYSNRAACHLSKKQHQSVIDDCNKSMELEPSNPIRIKILHRRAQARESLDQLSESLEDYNSILKLDPKFPQALQAQYRLPPRIKEKQEREKEEMIGKLKDLGNSILGKFGMSTDNFQFTKDPNTGGYSLNFKK